MSTVRGSTLAALSCGCVVDADDGVWEPCPEIAAAHARAVALVRQGVILRPPDYQSTWESVLFTIAAHVADQRQHAARMAAEQGGLL